MKSYIQKQICKKNSQYHATSSGVLLADDSLRRRELRGGVWTPSVPKANWSQSDENGYTVHMNGKLQIGA